MKLVLASQSPQRLAIVRALGLEVVQDPANIDEKSVRHEDPAIQAKLIAEAKARAVALRHPDSLIIAADTYCVLDAVVYEKPVDLDDARRMLREQSGKMMQEVTGIALYNTKTSKMLSDVKVVDVTFRDLTEKEIERYVTTEPVLTWSAAFCPAYETGMVLIESINGSFTSFTHGLPIEWLIEKLRILDYWQEKS